MQISIFETAKHLPKPIKSDLYKMAPGTLFTHPDYMNHGRKLMRLPSGNYRSGEKGYSKWKNAVDLDYAFTVYVENLLSGKTDLSIRDIDLEDVTGNVHFAGSSIDDWAAGGTGENVVLQQFLETECMRTLLDCVRRNVCANN